jgi:hypothetical protein
MDNSVSSPRLLADPTAHNSTLTQKGNLVEKSKIGEELIQDAMQAASSSKAKVVVDLIDEKQSIEHTLSLLSEMQQRFTLFCIKFPDDRYVELRCKNSETFRDLRRKIQILFPVTFTFSFLLLFASFQTVCLSHMCLLKEYNFESEQLPYCLCFSDPDEVM